ncbi:MAG: YebC/PmpR family DNA-binding transcriptional regulator, partial [Dialister sp.]|nr:YebC/PmpR family DNA-binding transcriptional regulator [Dialister sp.]
MSGHSKWENIKRKKGKTDAIRARITTKISKEITIAARMGGGDPVGNMRLKLALTKAKQNNVPKENIQRAIAKGVGAASGAGFDEVTYEGYGPGGAAVIVECNTDNRNRAAADIRHAFTHHGGSVGTPGCVGWMFKKKGSIIVAKDAADEDTVMMIALDAGADDVTTGEDSYEITTSPENFLTVSEALEKEGIEAEASELAMVPDNYVKLEGDAAQTMQHLNNELNLPEDGRIRLDKDQAALKLFLEDEVKPKIKRFEKKHEHVKWMVENGYYDEEVFERYTAEFIDGLDERLRKAGFRFRTFMSAYKFYAQYAMKTNDQKIWLEDFCDRVLACALTFADGDEELAEMIGEEIVHQRFQPATPSFLNAGRKRRGEFVSCFLLQTTDDMNSIGRMINSALQLSRIGGGVGINLSNLRGRGASIKQIKGAASGVVPVMKLLEDSFSYSNQLGQRQGAGAVYLNVFHPDVLEFLGTKKENADEKIRVKTLSLGLVVPDKFYEL